MRTCATCGRGLGDFEYTCCRECDRQAADKRRQETIAMCQRAMAISVKDGHLDLLAEWRKLLAEEQGE